MHIYYLVVFFILGSVLGSFFHVFATRLAEEQSIIYPPSHCPKCKHRLKWYELIPVISYIIQKGKCKECKADIPMSYVLIEVVTGILFSVCYNEFGFSKELIISLIFVSTMVINIVSDIEYMIILDESLVVSTLLIIITYIFTIGLDNTASHIYDALIAFFIMYGIKIVGDKMFKKESLGGGDIKLMFLFGLVIGWDMSICTIFLATFIAFAIALYIMFSKKDNMIPFGPFLCMAATLFLIWGINVRDIIMFLIK